MPTASRRAIFGNFSIPFRKIANTMSRTVLLFLALFAGAALAQSAVEAKKAEAAAYKHDGYEPHYPDSDTEYYGSEYHGQEHDDYHHGTKHGKHSKSHSKPYKLTITLAVTNPTFVPETFDAASLGIGSNGVFRFKLRETVNSPEIGDGVVTGAFYEFGKSVSTLPYDDIYYANDVASIDLTGGDFENSKLTAIGRLAWKRIDDTTGMIVDGTDTLTVTGGTGALLGATGTIKLVGGTAGATATLKLTVPKHWADHTGY